MRWVLNAAEDSSHPCALKIISLGCDLLLKAFDKDMRSLLKDQGRKEVPAKEYDKKFNAAAIEESLPPLVHELETLWMENRASQVIVVAREALFLGELLLRTLVTSTTSLRFTRGQLLRKSMSMSLMQWLTCIA